MLIFAWEQFPQYAARCIGAVVKATKEKVVVIATRPKVPVEGMEAACGCPVYWVSDHVNLSDECPDIKFGSDVVAIVSGWGYTMANCVTDAVRAAGGKVFCIVDNNLVLTAKEILRAIRFRLTLRKKYDGYFVPGKSGRRLLRFYGVDDERIAEGLYSADESLFDSHLVTYEGKENRIVYVGQYIDRKNVLAVCRAFEESGIKDKGWSLEMYGSGPLKSYIPYAQPFVQPEELPAIYRRAKAFVLASKEEHWGLVVHEAALSGCYLLLSNRVGAAEDLLSEKNGIVFNPFNQNAMTNAFAQLGDMSEVEWKAACSCSLEEASKRSLRSFVHGVEQLLELARHK